MEEVNHSGQKKKMELLDNDSKSLRKTGKGELQDDESFEVISISCNDSNKYLSDDCEDEEALVVSINDSMNKSFPKIQLFSDLIQSASSTTTLTPRNALSNDEDDDENISLKEVDLIPEIKSESFCDGFISSVSQDDQPSSIIEVSVPFESYQPILRTRYASLSAPSLSEQQQPGLQPVVENTNILDFHDEHANAVPELVHVLKKSATTTWTTCSSITTTEKYPNADAMRMSHEQNRHSSTQNLHSHLDGAQLRFSDKLSVSVPDFYVEGSDMTHPANTKMFPANKDASVSRLPKVSYSTMGIWRWLCPRNLLHAIFDKAWASIDAVITTLDPQMKSSSCVKPDFEIVVATANDIELLPIRKAFRKTFLGKVAVHHLPVTLGCIPLQPVGFQCGVYCAESRIKFMREHKLVERNKIIVATSPALVEVTPLRWHHTTCLMLDDPCLGLTLHTFTQTVPVPNIYANQVQLRTPTNYHLRHLGFNITVGKVISVMTGIPEEDWQYTLTGVSFSKILESAAVVLAGMYKSYLNGVSY